MWLCHLKQVHEVLSIHYHVVVVIQFFHSDNLAVVLFVGHICICYCQNILYVFPLVQWMGCHRSSLSAAISERCTKDCLFGLSLSYKFCNYRLLSHMITRYLFRSQIFHSLGNVKAKPKETFMNFHVYISLMFLEVFFQSTSLAVLVKNERSHCLIKIKSCLKWGCYSNCNFISPFTKTDFASLLFLSCHHYSPRANYLLDCLLVVSSTRFALL